MHQLEGRSAPSDGRPRTHAGRRALGLACLLSLVAAHVRAQDVVGDANDALPGYVHTHVAAERPVGFAVNAALGYGLTEALPDAPGTHQRVLGSIAVSGQPLSWLGLALRLDGRADFHGDDDMGRDRGSVVYGSFGARVAKRLPSGLALGTQLSMLSYGGDVLDGLSFEMTGLVAYDTGGFSIAGELGYRVDRSAGSVPTGAMYRRGDRLALGVGDFDALLARLGAGYRHDALEAMVEVRWDVLVGGGAPSLSASPLQVALGGRYHASPAVQLEATVDVAASSRPRVGDGDTIPFVAIAPRLVVRAALTYRFGRSRSPGDPASVPAPEDPVADGEDAPEERPDAPPVAGARSLRAVVYDDHHAPLVDARVVVRVGEHRVETFTDGTGAFVLEGIPPGDATIEITATSYAPITRDLGDGALSLSTEALTMARAPALGVLRGLVRDFDGHPVQATVRMRPGGASSRAAADGTFSLEVAPGRYTVTVEASGFETQSRQVELSDGQVTIVNVDLRAAH